MNRDRKPIEQDARIKYSESAVYDHATITHSLSNASGSFSDVLLSIKRSLLDGRVSGKRVLDIGCADGRHLAELAGKIRTGVGVDFSPRFVAAAKAKHGIVPNVSFVVSDARFVPFGPESFDLVYSFATLYHIDEVDKVFSEISRLLVRGGVAVLELGNARSLSTRVSRRPENSSLAQHSVRTIDDHLRALAAANLTVVAHRAFQILPMWGSLDGLLSVLRHPFADRLMTTLVGGKMVDERIANLPVIRGFAFRHLLVAEKR